MYKIITPNEVGRNENLTYLRFYPTGWDFRRLDVEEVNLKSAKGKLGTFVETDEPKSFAAEKIVPEDILISLAGTKDMVLVKANELADGTNLNAIELVIGSNGKCPSYITPRMETAKTWRAQIRVRTYRKSENSNW